MNETSLQAQTSIPSPEIPLRPRPLSRAQTYSRVPDLLAGPRSPSRVQEFVSQIQSCTFEVRPLSIVQTSNP